MAEQSYFFDSSGVGVNYYTSSQVADWLYQAQGRKNGVIGGLDNSLVPSTSGALNSTYNTGVATFGGRIYKNTASLPLSHVAPTSGYRRIDAVVVRFDNSTALAANLTIIQGVQKNDGSQVAPAITAGTDVLISTVLIDNSAGVNTTTVTDLRTWAAFGSVGSSGPYTLPANGPSMVFVSSTTNPFLLTLPAATGSGYSVRIINTTALATGLVKVIPATGDRIGPLAANVACYLQNVDQSTWAFRQQSILLIDSASGQWVVADGQFMPEPGSVDSAGTQYFLGKLRRLPLGNTTTRDVSISVAATGAWTSAIQITGVSGIPSGAKAIRASVYTTAVSNAGASAISIFAFSDNTSSTPSIHTAHPWVTAEINIGGATSVLTTNTCEMDIPLNASGQFFLYTINKVGSSNGCTVRPVGYYMGD